MAQFWPIRHEPKWLHGTCIKCFRQGRPFSTQILPFLSLCLAWDAGVMWEMEQPRCNQEATGVKMEAEC